MRTFDSGPLDDISFEKKATQNNSICKNINYTKRFEADTEKQMYGGGVFDATPTTPLPQDEISGTENIHSIYLYVEKHSSFFI